MADTTLRLNWPQWQGGEPEAVTHYTPGLSAEEGRVAYGVGGQLTAFLAPDHEGPIARVRVPEYSEDLPLVDGIVGKAEVLRQHEDALDLIRQANADRVVTLGGTCAVSLTPFSYLSQRYASDFAVVWLDSHADSNLPGGPNRGFNTMVVSHLSGHGDADVLSRLPATIATERILLAGVHGWDDQDSHTHESWGLQLVPPAAEENFTNRVLEWLHITGARHVAVHFDLDVINSDEHSFGMAWEKDGISKATALNTIARIASDFDLVGLTVAEFVPREAVALQSMLRRLPLLREGQPPRTPKMTD
ncbi:arginase family protein [Pedococcus sp. NPDC057267]|uniref:arginase family protein n=1 Tax=Pedococcus sp. NPDC057267 TaxID=3346077 RepID=UPI003627CD4A